MEMGTFKEKIKINLFSNSIKKQFIKLFLKLITLLNMI